MDFLNDIKGETLVICHPGFKKKVLSLNRLINIKMMYLDEFIKKYCFSYDEKAILYLIDNYHFSYEVASLYLKNIYYIEETTYHNTKLDFLVQLKKELDFHHLLIYNSYFKEYLQRVDLIFYDIHFDNYLKRILSNLKYRIVKRTYKNYNHSVFSFKTIEEECEFIANQIANLITKGINVNKIKLTNVSKEYYQVLQRIFTLFNLKVSLPYTAKLSSYQEVNTFILNYLQIGLEGALDQCDKTSFIYPELIKVINQYFHYNRQDLMIYQIKKKTIPTKKYHNAIEIIDYLDYYPDDDEYIFMLGFNDGIIPHSYRDIDYITDNLAPLVGLEVTSKKNIDLRKEIIDRLGNIKNLTITYKEKDNIQSYYPSTLCSYFKVSKGITQLKESYSEIYGKLKLMARYDEYLKYGNIAPDLKILNNNFHIDYNTYNNEYQHIEREDRPLTLSYSNMQIYNQCAFRYYLTQELKLNPLTENFMTIVGKMVHYTMERCLSTKDFNTNKYAIEFLKDRVFSPCEEFFIKKYLQELNNFLNEVISLSEYSLFDKAMYEKKVVVNYDDHTQFMGIIDKILYYTTHNQTYLALVDYKTGNDSLNLKYLQEGLQIQLPIYLYLSSKLQLEHPVYVGFYLQKLDLKDHDYRLEGYSNSETDILKIIDKNYHHSKIIKGLKINKDGSFAKSAKVLTSKEIDDIIKTTEQIILKTIQKIKDMEFTINPKKDGELLIGCEYCPFKDICFRKEKDFVDITKKGGDYENDERTATSD